MQKDEEKIRVLSLQFREAIVKANKNMLPESLHTFPNGACGDASLLLGEYLYQAGCGSFDYVVGMRNEQSHAWLEKERIVVDITADQFPDKQEAVIVTTDKRWHQQFQEDERNLARLLIYDHQTQRELTRALAYIIKMM